MKNKMKVTIASITTLTILLSSCGLNLTKKSPYEGKEVLESTTSYEQYSDYVNNYDDTILSTVVDSKNDETAVTDVIFYREKLKQISNKKNFDQYTIDILNETIDSLEKNYDTLYDLYSGSNLPSKNEFIILFIESIEKNVDSIVFVDPNDFFNEYASELGNAQAKFVHKTNTIIVNKNLSKKAIISNILHEGAHSEQDYIFESNECAQHNMYNIFTEGEAAWRTTAISEKCVRSNMALFIDGCSYFAYGVGASSYSIHSRYYKMLIDLAGFDVVQDCKTNFDYQTLIDSIESRYDIDAETFLSCIADVSSMVDIANDHDNMKKFITAENMYLDCIKADVEKASTKEEALNVFNKYRYYKLQYFVSAYDSNDNDITKEKFAIADLENKLLNKINEFNLLPEDKNKQVFDLCLFNLPDMIPKKEEISLKNVFYYEENGKIYFAGQPNNDMKVYDCSTNSFEYITFDQNIYDNCVPVLEQTTQKIM